MCLWAKLSLRTRVLRALPAHLNMTGEKTCGGAARLLLANRIVLLLMMDGAGKPEMEIY